MPRRLALARRRFLALILIAAVGWGAPIGCQEAGAPASPSSGPAAMRIVSLSPAISSILIELDLAGAVVGRDRYESRLPDSIPRVGDLSSVDAEALVALDPTDVLIQAGKRGAPPGLESLADTHGWNLVNLQIDGLDDVHAAITTVAQRLTYAGDDDARQTAAQRAFELNQRIDAALQPIDPQAAARAPTILLLYGVDPPSAFGPGSYLSDVLERLGGRNALTTGRAWQELDAETILAIAPGAVVLVDESTAAPADPAETRRRLGPVIALDIPAVENHRLYVLAEPGALIPGPSVIQVAGRLRALLLEMSATEAADR